ncbi:MAG: formimidoylglutamate deiminase [Alphaproteobacteria bacterium]
MTILHVGRALLATGWDENVRLEIDGVGRIARIEVGTQACDGDVLLKDDVLLPAPANLHSHAFQRAMAGLTEYRSSVSTDSFWTWRTLMYKFVAAITPDQVEAIAALVQMEMLEAGFGSIGEFHYLHHQPDGKPYDDPAEMSVRVAAAAKQTGIGLTHLPVLYMRGGCDDRPLGDGQVRFGHDLDRFAALIDAARPAVQSVGPDGMIGIAPHSLRAVTPDALKKAAASLGDGPVHIHIAEQTAEVDEVEAAYGARPVAWLLNNCDVDGKWCLIHATHMTDAETAGMAKSGAVAGLCPITEANLGDGIFNGVQFMEKSGAFGVGSDSNVRISLTEELWLLEYSQRLRDRSRVVFSGETGSAGRTLFEGSCRGGAQALGRGSGVIEVGAWADLVALDGNHIVLDGFAGDRLLDAFIFAGDDSLVRDVWSAGRHVVREGRHIARDRIVGRYRHALAALRGV